MFALFMTLLLLLGQTKSQPALPPSVEVVASNYEYEQTASSLLKSNFGNLNVRVLGSKDRVLYRVNLKNGKYHETEELGGQDVLLGPVQMFDLENGQPRHVILAMSETDWGGSSTDTGIVQILEIRNDRVYVVQQFTFDAQAPGTGSTFDPKSHKLVIRARTDDNTANCCPRHIDVVTFRWDSQHFEYADTETVDVRPTQ